MRAPLVISTVGFHNTFGVGGLVPAATVAAAGIPSELPVSDSKGFVMVNLVSFEAWMGEKDVEATGKVDAKRGKYCVLLLCMVVRIRRVGRWLGV